MANTIILVILFCFFGINYAKVILVFCSWCWVGISKAIIVDSVQRSWGKHSFAKKQGLRSALDYCDQIACTTSRLCLDYNDYGCWCGLAHPGQKPVDANDKCCEEHDECYRKAMVRKTCFFIFFEKYAWKCEDSNGHKAPVCNKELNSRCQQIACECDRKSAVCLGSNPFPDTKPRCPGAMYRFISTPNAWKQFPFI